MFVLCQSTVDTGIGRRMFVIDVVCGCGCSVIAAIGDESENTGKSINSKNIINKRGLFYK